MKKRKSCALIFALSLAWSATLVIGSEFLSPGALFTSLTAGLALLALATWLSSRNEVQQLIPAAQPNYSAPQANPAPAPVKRKAA